MHRFLTMAGLALATVVALAGLWPVQAQYVQVYSAPPPVVVSPPPVVTYSYYPPATVYAPPAVSYYAPAVSYYAPTVAYSVPSTVVYAPPVGTVTTRSYYGFGIFRPRGWYTQSYYTPGVSSSFYFR
jgi:hypothetical protein